MRLPHKTESLEKYQRQVNVGLGGGNRNSKYFDTEFDGRIGGKRTPLPNWFLEQHGIDKDYKGKFDEEFISKLPNEQKGLFGVAPENDTPSEEGTENRLKYAKGSEFEKKYGEPWDRFGKNTNKFKKQDNVPGKSSPTYKGFNDRYKQSVEKYKDRLLKVDGAILATGKTIIALGRDLPSLKTDLTDEMAIGSLLNSVDDYQKMFSEISTLVATVTASTSEKVHTAIENLIDIQVNDKHLIEHLQESAERSERYSEMLVTGLGKLEDKVRSDSAKIETITKQNRITQASATIKMIE